MQYLPDSVHIVHNDNTIFEICHTIFIDKDNLKLVTTLPLTPLLKGVDVSKLVEQK